MSYNHEWAKVLTYKKDYPFTEKWICVTCKAHKLKSVIKSRGSRIRKGNISTSYSVFRNGRIESPNHPIECVNMKIENLKTID